MSWLWPVYSTTTQIPCYLLLGTIVWKNSIVVSARVVIEQRLNRRSKAIHFEFNSNGTSPQPTSEPHLSCLNPTPAYNIQPNLHITTTCQPGQCTHASSIHQALLLIFSLNYFQHKLCSAGIFAWQRNQFRYHVLPTYARSFQSQTWEGASANTSFRMATAPISADPIRMPWAKVRYALTNLQVTNYISKSLVSC